MGNKFKYIDIHSHVNFQAFNEDRDEVINRALENDTWIINVGTQIDTSKKALEIAHQYKEGVYAIVGLHPIHTESSYHDEQEIGEGGKEFTSRGEIFEKDAYLKLLKDPKVLAMGECGLDYFRMSSESIIKQKKAFIEQIKIANEINKPLMLHIRNNKEKEKHLGVNPKKSLTPELNAYVDALEILKTHAKVKGDVHFFAGSKKDAKAFIDFGFTLSFTGVITFTTDYDEVIKNIPLNMIMSETDAPYVAPLPYRGKRNEPLYVREIVKKIAELKKLSEQEVAETMVNNAKRVFGI
jgi:TatD DNase family protein